MSLLTYVSSYEDIRALLGVSSDELADSTMELRVFERSMIEGFYDIDITLDLAQGTVLAAFAVVSAIANASRTSNQQSLFANVQSYATYYVAGDLASTLPQFSPKTITDGKAMVQRHADSGYRDTLAGIAIGKARAGSRLKRAYTLSVGGTVTAATVFDGLLISVPDSDPVTGS